MEVQHTIADGFSLEGPGLFSGQPSRVTFLPAPEQHGVVFVHLDAKGTEIPALVRHVARCDRRTALEHGAASIQTCEHCLSALAGMAIDNVRIEVSGDELPGLDGSALPYLQKLRQVGRKPCGNAPRRCLVIKEPVVLEEGGATIAALPHDRPALEVVYDLEYPQTPSIGRQVHAFEMGLGPSEGYARQIAPARTFVLEEEAKALQQRGWGRHLTADDVLVVGPEGPLGANGWRQSDEPVRHKILDVIGDLYLLGAAIQGRVICFRSGHPLNHALVRRLLNQYRHQNQTELRRQPATMDIRQLFRLMPHRYPMLLVDRVLELEGDQRAVGIKNVTINEPFFQGHYPGTPIMPGVLIVEALAQLSGVLIAQSLEHRGKIPVLLSLDRVKLRKPVTPGDQLVMEAESVRVRRRIAHMRCRGYVADELAAEAEVRFMLVDDDQPE